MPKGMTNTDPSGKLFLRYWSSAQSRCLCHSSRFSLLCRFHMKTFHVLLVLGKKYVYHLRCVIEIASLLIYKHLLSSSCQ